MTWRKDVESYQKEAWWTMRRMFTHVALPAFVFFALLSLLGVISLPFRTARGIAERTLNSDNVLQNYEWFKQTHQDVLAADVQLQNAKLALEDFRANNPRPWDYPTSTEAARLGSIVLGIQNQRQNLVAQYNARSRMLNRSLFKTNDLPEELR